MGQVERRPCGGGTRFLLHSPILSPVHVHVPIRHCNLQAPGSSAQSPAVLVCGGLSKKLDLQGCSQDCLYPFGEIYQDPLLDTHVFTIY